MEGFSVWIHLEGFSGTPSLRNLSNPVGLITYTEQKSIHLITKRCDKNAVTLGFCGKLLANWNSLDGEERETYRKQFCEAP